MSTVLILVSLGLAALCALVLVAYETRPRHKKHMPEGSKPQAYQAGEELERQAASRYLSVADMAGQKLAIELEERLDKVVALAASQVAEGLDAQLQQHRKQLASKSETIQSEMADFAQELKQEQAKFLTSMQEAMEQQQQALSAATADQQKLLEAEAKQRHQAVLKAVDERLGEVAVTYIVDALGKGVDLGAQHRTMLDYLEQHKDELRKDLETAA